MSTTKTETIRPPERFVDVQAPPDRRIRVVFVIDNMRLGGTELNAVRTAERLDRDRFELRVVCLGADGPLTERYRAMGVPVENMPISSFYGWSMVKSGLRFARVLRQERVDIVHAHDVYSNIFAAVWARLARVPVLITSRRWWTSLPNRKLKLGSRFAVAGSTAILANSGAVARQVIAEDPRTKGRVWAITNFVDEDAFDQIEEDECGSLRRQWNAPSDAVVIGCVARFDPIKDHAGLVRAFAMVRSADPRAHLVMIGDGPERGAVEALASELGVQGSVHFTGEQRSSANLHRGFDISVLASTSEGFPNTLVEAMAAGKPVVATNVGGNADAVVEDATGFLVPPSDAQMLSAALLRVTRNPELRAQFGHAGRQRARHQFAASKIVCELENMYVKLVQRAEG